MGYIDNIKTLLSGHPISANGLEHGLAEIVKETNSHGYCTRDFVIINNAYFRLFDEFKANWQQELQRFCEEMEISFSLINNNQTIEFRKQTNLFSS